MEWYTYLAAFFAGAFLSNAVPHFVQGVSGNKFPTPFAKPPGRGLSSSLVNVIWGLSNLIVGCILTRKGAVSMENYPAFLVCFAGFVLMSIMLGLNFQHKEKE